jgi:hypothetical protein
MTEPAIRVFNILSEVKLKFATAILLVALLVPTNTWAQSVLKLSCGDITKIEVWRFRGRAWRCPPNDGGSRDGYHYPIIIYLTKEAQKRVKQVYDSTEETPFMVDDCKFLIQHVQIMAKEILIESADPTRDNFRGDEGIIITKKTKEAAFEAARQICADKVETAVFTDGS